MSATSLTPIPRLSTDARAGHSNRPAGRVLFITENAPVPADRRVWNECRTLAGAGWEVVVVAPLSPKSIAPTFEVREGVEIHRYPLQAAAGGARGYLREYGQAAWRIRKVVRRLTRERRFDIVHASNPPDYLLLTARSARRQGARFVFDHHDVWPELYRTRFGEGISPLLLATRAAERLAFGMADVTLATNESYRRIALARGRKPPADVFVVRNGPDRDRFRPVAPDPDYGADVAISWPTSGSWVRKTALTMRSAHSRGCGGGVTIGMRSSPVMARSSSRCAG